MKLVEYVRVALRSETSEPSTSQMILCGIATGFPLMIGLYKDQLSIAIYGALTGYFLTVHDHVGTLSHRLKAATITFFMLVIGFALGLHMQLNYTEFMIILGILTYWVGLMGGDGAEFEKAVLFSTFQMIVAMHSVYIGPEKSLYVLGYALTGYGFVVIGTLIHLFFSKKPIEPFTKILDSIKKPLVNKLELHLHAVSYVVITLFTAWLMDHYHVERGYWTIITVLLVMKPDRTQSLYRSFQRLVGTCGGVLLSVGVIYMIHSPIVVLLLITLCAFFVPWAMKKNYWIVSFLIAVIIILLLELPNIKHGNFHTPMLRLRATAFGSILGVVGVIISKILDTIVKKNKLTT